MYHGLLRTASFWEFLFTVDEQLAAESRKAGCSCAGRLHCANYPRNPRGGCENLPESYRHRLSFCCDRDGCRKRTTPPSVRFLGRKVFLGAVVVLVAAMRQGPSPRRGRDGLWCPAASRAPPAGDLHVHDPGGDSAASDESRELTYVDIDTFEATS